MPVSPLILHFSSSTSQFGSPQPYRPHLFGVISSPSTLNLTTNTSLTPSSRSYTLRLIFDSHLIFRTTSNTPPSFSWRTLVATGLKLEALHSSPQDCCHNLLYTPLTNSTLTPHGPEHRNQNDPFSKFSSSHRNSTTRPPSLLTQPQTLPTTFAPLMSTSKNQESCSLHHSWKIDS